MTVSLTNTSGRCLVFVLAHEAYFQALRWTRATMLALSGVFLFVVFVVVVPVAEVQLTS